MSIDTKTAVLFCLPLLTIAVAWGESMSRLNTLEEQQSKLVTLNQLETIKVEIGYIKKQNEENLDILKQILGRINVK